MRAKRGIGPEARQHLALTHALTCDDAKHQIFLCSLRQSFLANKCLTPVKYVKVDKVGQEKSDDNRPPSTEKAVTTNKPLECIYYFNYCCSKKIG